MSKKAAAGAMGPKVYVGLVRLLVPAGKAAPAPPVGPALGQRGLNLMDFCKAFNDQTKDFVEGTPIPVKMEAFSDRTFTFKIKTPQTSWFLKRAAGVAKGAATPGKETVGEVSLKHIYEIAKVKQQDMAHVSLENICSQIVEQAKNIGLKVTR
mmetsp:Transcript_18267/g.43515  ORF Transcript_18267/g.43515 Transcript_18267/m.43515 type:complete len:153 (-) Transcript_18267:108-566(-)|eukprot:CAMPEP_0177691408 /NCGR_PEP_ID=MMETSP0484_2-20121128/1295_1 /TAXON_ID=354590 /ORGANISM="Rhodomonas lens, Strain RHODO" /LENGTH=152 /DNA_ID=CAMNT_0019202039 /DNA_START=126 /DNA_END=584 /DNA_ORIENTATION=-